MPENGDRLDLVQRLADKQNNAGKQSLAERAAEKLALASHGDRSPSAASADMPQKPKTDNTSTKNKASSRENRRLTLDFRKLEDAGFITPDMQQSHVAEEFRAIKLPLLRKAFGTGKGRIERGNVILVTSAQPGEGKTFTAINLAMSIASERDLHVLLIDIDVYRHDLENILEIKDQKGLVDLLVEDDLNLPDLLVRTNIPNLTILPVGNKYPEAPELLSSHKMIALMADIAARYPDRVIIIDSPPILASSEASVFAPLVGQIVMVVEANKTNQENVAQALKRISTCENISFVVNKVGSDSIMSPYRTYEYYDEYRKQK